MHTLNNPLEAPMLPTPPLSGKVVAPSPSLETVQSSERNVSGMFSKYHNLYSISILGANILQKQFIMAD